MRAPEVPYERFLAAVLDNPRKPGEGAMTYVARIAEIAGLKALAVLAGDAGSCAA